MGGMEDYADGFLLDLVSVVRADSRAFPQIRHYIRHYTRRRLKALKAECRRRGLVRACRAAKPRFPRAGG